MSMIKRPLGRSWLALCLSCCLLAFISALALAEQDVLPAFFPLS